MLSRSKNNIVTLTWAFVVIFLISSLCAFGEPGDDAAVPDEVSVTAEAEAPADMAVTDEVPVTDEMPAADEEPVTDEMPVMDVPVSADAAAPADESVSAGMQGQTDIPVKEETVFYYTVKKGDTLWDISKHFFDSPYLWPDVWSENAQITNPHLIYPGNRIRIFQKDGVIHISLAPPEEEKPVEPEVIEPEPVEEVAAAEPVQDVEPAFEEPEEVKDLPSFPYINIDSIGFVRQEAAQSYGYIFRIKDGAKLASKGSVVYIKQKKEEGGPELIPGSLYAIFRIREKPVKDPETRDYVGIQHDLKGVLEITDILQESPVIAEAKVVKNFRDISPGDLLMPFKRRTPLMALKRSPDGLTGKILLSEDHGKVFGEHTLVFVDIGSRNGVIPGQEYDVYYKEKLDNVFSKSINAGKLLVLHTEPTTSTAIILRTQRNLEPGMEIRSAKY